MIENRSVPADAVLPHIVYRDVTEAITWLTKVFGFSEQYRYGEPVSGAQMRFGAAWMMLRRARDNEKTPAQSGCATQSLTIFVDDIENHFERAKAAGARIVEDLHETVYGEKQYGAEDLDGHHWLFSKHARDAAPEEWGATVAETSSRVAVLPRPRWCYFEIPAVSVQQSVQFYETVFGWNIRHRESERPSFDDATGNVSGAWVTGRDACAVPGLLPYIWVDSIRSVLDKVASSGGTIIKDVCPDEPGADFYIATFRDPAGNVIGLYQA